MLAGSCRCKCQTFRTVKVLNSAFEILDVLRVILRVMDVIVVDARS